MLHHFHYRQIGKAQQFLRNNVYVQFYLQVTHTYICMRHYLLAICCVYVEFIVCIQLCQEVMEFQCLLHSLQRLEFLTTISSSSYEAKASRFFITDQLCQASSHLSLCMGYTGLAVANHGLKLYPDGIREIMDRTTRTTSASKCKS